MRPEEKIRWCEQCAKFRAAFYVTDKWICHACSAAAVRSWNDLVKESERQLKQRSLMP